MTFWAQIRVILYCFKLKPKTPVDSLSRCNDFHSVEHNLVIVMTTRVFSGVLLSIVPCSQVTEELKVQ